MPRNYVLLLIPSDIGKDVLDEYIRTLFLPFAREYRFPPYTCPCYCNGLEESIKFANKSTRHFHQYWRSFSIMSLSNRPDWKDYIKNWETALLSFRSDVTTPDPVCDMCKGNGYFKSFYYPLNMYDYWHGLKGEYLGTMAELKAEWRPYEMPGRETISLFQLIAPFQRPFMFYNVVAPDGLPYNRWDYSNKEKWYEVWQGLAHQWQDTSVIRCLVHE